MEDMLMAANAANPSQQGSTPNPPAPASTSGALRGGAPAAAVAVSAGAGSGGERRVRPQKEKALNCPRCNSTNTKFCYYNNYSLQQPRYFCKTCRRYWTEGGSLRNVPVGGGSRKNKRSSSSASSAAPASTSAASLTTSASASNKNPKLTTHEGAAQDLNLAFPHHHGGLQHAHGDFAAFPSLESSSVGGAMPSNSRGGGGALGAISAMELLRSTGCYMPLQVPMQMPGDYAAAAGFSYGEFRAPPPPPSSQSVLGFSLDAHGSAAGAAAAGYGSAAGLQQGAPENIASRLLFPFEDLKPPVSSGGGDGSGGASGGAGDGNGGRQQFEQGKDHGGAGHDTPGYWNGMIGGSGASW
jgi:hypothetical protein